MPTSSLDLALTAQIAVAWAGESGDDGDRRLGWWASNLVHPDGGMDLFQRLLPSTWNWAVYQAVREAARRRDEELRNRNQDADRLVTLYSFGFSLDERIEDRLLELKRTVPDPTVALAGLREVLRPRFDRNEFADWVRGHGTVESETVPSGRRLKGSPPESLDTLVGRLVAALDPLEDTYPMPHYRRAS